MNGHTDTDDNDLSDTLALNEAYCGRSDAIITEEGGLAFVTNLTLVIYCLLEHMLREAGADESVRELFLDFDQIALTKAKLPNGAEVSRVEDALPFHYGILDRLGPLIGEYCRQA